MEIMVAVFVLFVVLAFIPAMLKENYHDKDVSENIINAYGQPEESFFLQRDVFTIHQHSSISDSNDMIRFDIETDFPSLHDHTCIYDQNGKKISEFSSSLFSFHDRHTITMASGICFDVTSELFRFFSTVMNIDELGWKLEGDFFSLNFTIKDRNNELIAVICQKAFSFHDRYCIDIYNTYYTNEIITIVIVLQHIIRRRSQQHSNSTSSN